MPVKTDLFGIIIKVNIPTPLSYSRSTPSIKEEELTLHRNVNKGRYALSTDAEMTTDFTCESTVKKSRKIDQES